MKILIVRVGQLGDMVMATPAIASLLMQFPNAEFTLLTSNDGRRLLRHYDPRITELWLYDRKSALQFLIRRRLRALVREGDFDHIYCFESNPSFLRLFTDSKATVHVIKKAEMPTHFARLCLNAVNADPNKPIYANLAVPDAAAAKAKAILAERGIDDQTFVVAFHPSFSGLYKITPRWRKTRKHKFWAVENWAELARMIQDYAQQHHLKLRIISDLAPEDKTLGEQLTSASNQLITVMIPPLDFERYKATLQRVDLLITPDTGPMHLASALGTNIVALFSNKDPRDCGPYSAPEKHTVIQAEQVGDGAKGIDAISPKVVFDACLKYFPTE